VNLNLDLHTNQQAYLRGKGINTELEGQVSIRGTASEPKIVGYFKTLRGDADILGKRFVINSGELRFEGYRGLLNIQATHTRKDQDFIAKVFGSLDSLDVRLESNPPLPEDETLSQLLFGKALDDISAIQALRIAAAVRSFSTNGSGLDPLATTRNLLGVDQVTIDSENTDSGQENYKLGVGKYVSDKVYVEIQRSTDPTDPWQGKVQIELTPNISLDTSAESNGGSNGIDITWKRDY
jgi:translocation and assembly module TamB